MAWLFAQELAASNSACDSPSETPTALWVTSSGTPTQRPASWRGWRTRPWIALLSGTISRPSMADRGAAAWILSLAATPASRSPLLAVVEALKMNDTYGRTSRESSERQQPLFASLRMSPAICHSDCARSSQSFRTWVTGLRSMCAARRKSAHRTDASGSGSWPTATAGTPDAIVTTGAGRGERTNPTLAYAIQSWPTPRTITGGAESGERKQALGREESGGGDLQAAAIQWQTPAAHQFPTRRQVGQATREELLLPAQAQAWATPTARDHKDGSCDLSRNPINGLLGRQVLAATGPASTSDTGPRRQLNPAFVDWLMGWPPGWSACEPLETESYRSWLREHSSALRGLLSATDD